MTGTIIILCTIWMGLGCVACIIWNDEQNTDGWELCNPYW